MPGRQESIDGKFVAVTQDRFVEAATPDDKYVVYIIGKESVDEKNLFANNKKWHVKMVIIKNINYPHIGKEVGYLTEPRSLITPEIVSRSFGMTLEQIYKKGTN